MKKLILPAVAILLAATSAGIAQDNNGRGEGRGRGGDRPPQQQQAAPAPAAPAPQAAPQGRAGNPASADRAARDRANANQLEQNRSAYPNRSGRVEQQQQVQRNDNNNNGRGDFNGNRNGNGNGNFNNNNNRPGPNFNNNGNRNNNRGFDTSRRFDDRARRDARSSLRYFGRNWTAPNRFRVGVYIGPTSGWNYRRYSYGQYLPRTYFSTNYWLNDWSFYGLDFPPPGTVWVRYGPDALLIDNFTGEILEVAYNIFY